MGSTILSLKKEGFDHFQYILTTATRKAELEGSYRNEHGTPKNVKVIAESFFEDHTAKDIVDVNGQKPSLAYDMMGVFSYTTRPDRVLKLLYDSMADDGKVFLNTSMGQMKERPGRSAMTHNWIQLADGRFVSYLDYIREYGGFKIEEVPYQSKGRKSDEAHETSVILTKIPGQNPQYPEVEVVESRGYKPPQLLFRVVDPKMSAEQKIKNEAPFWHRPWDQLPGMRTGDEVLARYRNIPPHPNIEQRADFEKLEKALSHYSDVTVTQTDPLLINDMVIGKVQAYDVQVARKYFDHHQKSIRATGEYGIACEALLELSEGKTSSPSLEYLGKKLAHRISPNDWYAEAQQEKSNVPFTVRSILETAAGVKSTNYGKERFNLRIADPQLKKNKYLVLESLEVSGKILFNSWASNPRAVAWLKSAIGTSFL